MAALGTTDPVGSVMVPESEVSWPKAVAAKNTTSVGRINGLRILYPLLPLDGKFTTLNGRSHKPGSGSTLTLDLILDITFSLPKSIYNQTIYKRPHRFGVPRDLQQLFR